MVYSEVLQAEEPVYDSSRPFPSLELLYKYKLSNTPDKTILGMKVTFPPNASTPPHTHAGAFVTVHVLTGSVRNKMNNNPLTIQPAGSSFHEAPGCHHKISDNASATEEATILVTFILETEKLEGILGSVGVNGLVVVDEEYREELRKRFEG
ncbi:hypothetical protein HYALB_00012508 [Hymenoscyphus albidus]|uniref:Cupin type-2 domain-containing protein n=1 Tax=Hymenoscyphus albidus TaxID=595503 RepID=A0A9N9Q6U7_9HELO|nr:hypothetical protein HYALB_00012508 [Hymenoscyphus albidus]